MTPEIIFVFVLLAATIILFVGEWIRLDLVAMLAVLALAISGILSPAEALAGFSNSLVITIAGLFIVGAALEEVGVANAMGRWLGRVAGSNELRLITIIMLVVALLSAFLSSTGTVAIFLPVVVSLALSARISPSRLLIPLSYASLIGGMLTLIGTPPNLAVSTALRDAGLEPFNFFSFTPIGLIMLVIGILFVALIGRHLLPDRVKAGQAESDDGPENRPLIDLAAAYALPGNLFRMQVAADSPLVDRSIGAARLRKQYQVSVLEIQSRAEQDQPVRLVTPDTQIAAGDILYVQGETENANRFAQEQRLSTKPVEQLSDQPLAADLDLVEVLLPPYSGMIGRSIAEVRLRDQYEVTVLGIRRLGEPLTGDVINMPLSFGDTLLVGGTRRGIARMARRQRDFVVVGQPAETRPMPGLSRRAPLALAWLLGMLILMTFEIVPTVIAVLLAAFAMVVTGCLPVGQVYRRINWESVVLIAGMIPMATALETTGGLAFISSGLVDALGDYGPLAMLLGLFLLTSLFSQFISNTATSLLVAPIGIQVAATLDISPYPLLMGIAIAASTAFSTPVASPTNTLVLDPGGYRFVDYARLGIPLQLLLMVATLLAVPLLFPF